ncbi:MAG TPA: hypothetical protein VHB48_19865, partial [Chitinophagaceae bacterium]|nr:hypothetical protein [Chitinophagaceae bacterium]
MIRTLSKIAGLFCLLLHVTALPAQFKNKATLEPVKETGFYSIYVSPELSGYVKTDFSDLRIMDEEEKPSAYIVREYVTRQFDSVRTILKIISNTITDSGKSVLIIQNLSAVRYLTALAFILRNNAVSRAVDVSGSDDKIKWYSIVENGIIGNKYIKDTDKYLEVIDMPPSSFKYFRVTVYNGTKDPLDILSAGDYYSFQYKWNNPYTLNPESGYRQVDSADGWSYIFVHDSLLFHKVMINMKMIVPGFYRRNCALLVNGKAVTNFSISGDSLVSRPVPLFNAGDWVVKIYNGDNPALKIRSVYTFQLDNRIIAWLDSGKAYHLEMNDS